MNCFDVKIKCDFDFTPSIRFVCMIGGRNKIQWFVDKPIEFAYDEVGVIKKALLSSTADWRIESLRNVQISPMNGRVVEKKEIEFQVLTVNESLDKEYIVRAIVNSAKSELTIIHYGKREIFNVSEGIFRLADGGTFNVIKQ